MKRDKMFRPKLAYTIDHRSAFVLLFSSVPLVALLIYMKHPFFDVLYSSVMISVALSLRILIQSEFVEFNKLVLIVGSVFAIAAISEYEGAARWLAMYQLGMYIYFVVANGLLLRRYMYFWMPPLLLVVAACSIGVASARVFYYDPMDEQQTKFIEDCKDKVFRRLDAGDAVLDSLYDVHYSRNNLPLTSDTLDFFTAIDTLLTQTPQLIATINTLDHTLDSALGEIERSVDSDKTRDELQQYFGLVHEMYRSDIGRTIAFDSAKTRYQRWKRSGASRTSEDWIVATRFAYVADSLEQRVYAIVDMLDEMDNR